MPPIHFKNLASNNKGQVAVEAAILVPVLLILIAGIFVVGNWVNATFTVNAAAREGARNFVLTGSCERLLNGVQNTMAIIDNEENDGRTTVSVLPNPLPLAGEDVTVEVKFELPNIFPFFKSYYENQTGKSYWFGEALGRANARMEVDPSDFTGCSS